MILREGTLTFDFSDAVDGFRFDEQDPTNPNFHGLSHCMKAVDFIVELEDQFLFVEVKDPPDPTEYVGGSGKEKFDDLVKSLSGKFRDTF
ncbi:MAG: hypothetical protein O3A46_13815, partial [Candidatus Poribacteria bacterium]|nr:hypothetical protein [Candidatus Poribacteria bacterium]